MGYMGCGTMRNKLLWGVFAALVVVAAILLGVGMSNLPKCRKKLPTECGGGGNNLSKTRTSQMTPDCRQIFVNCWRPFMIMCGIGVVALILALVTTCLMCCCGKGPDAAYACQQGTGVQMATATVANPYHTAYEQHNQPSYQGYSSQQQQPPSSYPTGYYAGGSQQQMQQQPYAQQQQPQGYPSVAAATGYPYQPQSYQQAYAQQQGTPFAQQAPAGQSAYPAQVYPGGAAQQQAANANYPPPSQGNVPVQHI